MQPEIYFLRYAFPCAQILLDLKEIDETKLKELENIAKNQEKIEKDELKKLFYRAFEKLGRFSKKINKEIWDIETIRQYFQQEHNNEIERKEGFYAKAGETICELSKVKKAEIIKKINNFLIVKYDDKTRAVSNLFVPNAEIGDKVFIHFGYAIEIVN